MLADVFFTFQNCNLAERLRQGFRVILLCVRVALTLDGGWVVTLSLPAI